MVVNKLSDIVKPNANFKNAINLYLDINKRDKVESYIPTKSSLNILNRYLKSVHDKKGQSTILIGSYGKGKSHLILVLLAILSMQRNEDNNKTIKILVERVGNVDSELGEFINDTYSNNVPFLPVIVMGGQDDLSQAFMIALNEALKRADLVDIMPDTFFSYALDTIKMWKKNYPDTYEKYVEILSEYNITVKEMEIALKQCNADKLNCFKQIYPELTAGSVFNPLAGGNVLAMYKGVADKLKADGFYRGIYVVFDEFSKYMEGQDNYSTGNNMKLLQDMCELANDSKDIYLTMVAHKSIKEYGKYLSDSTINAFTGIEGRIEEILFVTSSKNNYELVQNAIQKEENIEKISQLEKYFSKEIIDKYYSIAAFRAGFIYDDFKKIVVRGCYPLSPISAYALLNISEKVAQNERTLFTFVSKEEPFSMAKYIVEHNGEEADSWLITPDLIYDYFKNIFKKEVSNEFIHTEWINADYAISKADSEKKRKILKILSVINIINKFEELPATEEILAISSGLSDAKDVIQELANDKLIYKKGSNNCYTFKTRAGAELKNEIKRRRELKADRIDYNLIFEEISDMQFVLPKKYNYDYFMTRYFRYEFMNVKDFLQISDASVFFSGMKYQDGKVLVLYSLEDGDFLDDVRKKVVSFNTENLVVVFSTLRFKMKKQARDYEIIQDLKKDVEFVRENEVLLRELYVLQEDIETEIAEYIDNAFKNSENRVIGYFHENWKFDRTISIEKAVDIVCENYYHSTMVINNELINKQNLSAPVKKARRIIVESIIEERDNEGFLIGTSAEATIYRAVMINSGVLKNEREDVVDRVLDIFEQYLNECVENINPLNNLVSKYKEKPFGMRNGVLPILLAYALSLRNEDIIVYYEDKEATLDADTVINMCEHPNEYAIFISKEDVDKEKYLEALSDLFESRETNSKENRIVNVLISMQRWYRSLPQNAKNIRRTNKYIQDEKIIKILPKLRNIMQRVDGNAYEIIFTILPKLCSSECKYEETISTIKEIKSLLNGYMQWLLEDVIEETILAFDKKKKEDLSHTLKNWYDMQSNLAKNGLHNSRITGFMSCISSIDTFDEQAIIQKIIKIVTETYVDAWNDESYDLYITRLKVVKNEIESIEDAVVKGQYELQFIGKDGEPVNKYYEMVDESTGAIFRNILGDTLEDFSDLSVNEKVAILLEAIENVIKRGE